MDLRYTKSILVFICLLGAWFSFAQIIPDSIKTPVFKKELQTKRFDLRLSNYQNEYFTDCKKNIREDALRIVDSLLGIGSAPVDIDTFKLLKKPTRPNRPKYDYKVDTMEAKKIFN